MKRKLLTVVLVVVLCFTSIAGVSAKEDKYGVEREYVISYLVANGFGECKLSSPTELKNLEDGTEAVCFALNGKGYLILNLKDFTIPEFSFEKKSPFTNAKGDTYYNGVLEYYEKIGESLVGIESENTVVDYKKLKSGKKIAVDIGSEEKEKKIKEGEETAGLIKDTKSFAMSSYIESGDLNNSLRTWSSEYYCGVDATAILLMYYDDYYNGNFVNSSNDSNPDLQEYLINNDYLPNSSLSSSGVVSGTNGKTGLNDYLSDVGVYGSYSAALNTYSWGLLKTKIDSDVPVFAVVPPQATWSTNHDVVIHGYFSGYDGVPYAIVNDNFGRNNVYISASSVYNIYYIVQH